jgi:hypothetical protein
MKRAIFLALTALLSWQLAMAQKSDHINGDHFQKRVIYNAYPYLDENKQPVYNLEGKGVFDKIFFGFTNSPVEYIIAGMDSQGGLRLYRDRPDSRDWKLQIIPITDHWMAVSEVERDIKMVEIPWDYLAWLQPDLRKEVWENYYGSIGAEAIIKLFPDIPKSVHEELQEHNRKAYRAKESEETYTSRRPETKIFAVGRLGDILYDKVFALISNFRAEGGIMQWDGGYGATFRCVVGDELWSLHINNPENRAERMSDLCVRIIRDAMEGGQFDEEKYISELEKIEF